MTNYFSMSCSHCKREYAGSQPDVVMADFYKHQLEDHENELKNPEGCREKYEENKEALE